MDIRALKLVCFSPTGTTRSIVQAVAKGIDQRDAELMDITKPEARTRPLRTSENELLIIAVPVYSGRVPAVLLEWLNSMEIGDTPVVCIVVYGNREYEDALLELRDIVAKQGAVPIACAAYIGEHSFSSPEIPIAVARPDENDLRHAESFGGAINKKLLSIASIHDVADTKIPGNHPYRDRGPGRSVDFMAVSDACTQCGLCEESCPVSAIDLENGIVCDEEKCILCCACIKCCPENARTMKPGKIKDIAIRLSETCSQPKEPVFFV